MNIEGFHYPLVCIHYPFLNILENKHLKSCGHFAVDRIQRQVSNLRKNKPKKL